ncbi:MAG: DUF86 domain-containing protein [Cyclobacteriaceae bacterium]|jgi:uncharacterized protein with HEPN domain
MDDKVLKYLSDILAAINRINDFIGSPKEFEKYQKSVMLRQAVERNIEIIGEALNSALKINPSLEISNARKIVDTRNRIIHGYDEVEDVVIWSILIKHLPILHAEIQKIINQQ